ncbi:hypothetical protein ACFODZ_02155 [Marinicella sediminis]|uniref:Uncharacterized protein n=1 Tax=Marinicella sediminis TaxID=1792834 RepID=A0ABV7J7W7_9GAMM|nr:hypothetical protein [Marinicella sediminis]
MAFKLLLIKSELIKGALLFGLFDTAAALMLGEFSWLRTFGMAAVGGTFYAIEIPSYFAWLEQRSQHMSQRQKALFKTGMAVVYFNPLWIARHMCFIYWLNGQTIDLGVLHSAWQSFLYGMPVSAVFNYLIQNHIAIKHRFLASSLFSGCMAIFYAVSAVYFKS